MPGDPDVLYEANLVPAVLTTADLLMAVAVKLPPFWPDNIMTWLVQAESQFCLKGVITSPISSTMWFKACLRLMQLKFWT